MHYLSYYFVQVYAYLLRIGYICRKFKELNNLTSYEKKIGLDQYVKKTASKRKYMSSASSEYHFETGGKDTGREYFDQQDYQKKVRVDKQTSECILMDMDKSTGTLMEEKYKVLSCSNHGHHNEMVVSQSNFRSMESRKLSDAPDGSCSFLKAYTNWDFESILFPNIANRSELEIEVPAEHLLPCSIHLSKKKYRYDVQNMRNNRQIRGQDDQLKFSISSAHWKGPITVTLIIFS